jgi:DNA invertase Pin-like site-specific DNA recombinase
MACKEVFTMRRAYSYIRFSKKHQAKGGSLERQLERTRAYCAREGLTLVEKGSYQDLGVSGWTGKNGHAGQLAAFREAVKMGTVPEGSVLIVENLDRLSRQDLDPAYQQFREILAAGVEIHTLKPEWKYTKESLNDPYHMMFAAVDMHRANAESDRKSDLSGHAWETKRKGMRERPATSVCPGWLRFNKDTGRFEPIPERVRAVLRVYELARDGYGRTQMTKQLKREGIPPIGKEAKDWCHSSLADLLKNKAVIGECQPRVWRDGKRVPVGEPIKGYYPRIMSDEAFYATRAAVTLRKKQRGRRGNHVRNLFTELVRDARDGHPMIMKTNKSGSSKYYFVSGGVVSGQSDGLYASFPYQLFEDEFLKWLNDELVAALLRDGPKNLEQRREALSGQLMDVARREQVVAQKLAENPESEVWEKARVNVEAEKKAASAALEALRREETNNHTEALGQARSLSKMLRDCPPEELPDLRTKLKGRIRSLVEEIWVLVEGKPRDKWATVQVFLRNGKWFRYTVAQRPGPAPERRGPGQRCGGILLGGYSSARCFVKQCEVPPTAERDLRQWRSLDNPPHFGRDGCPAK